MSAILYCGQRHAANTALGVPTLHRMYQFLVWIFLFLGGRAFQCSVMPVHLFLQAGQG